MLEVVECEVECVDQVGVVDVFVVFDCCVDVVLVELLCDYCFVVDFCVWCVGDCIVEFLC